MSIAPGQERAPVTCQGHIYNRGLDPTGQMDSELGSQKLRPLLSDEKPGVRTGLLPPRLSPPVRPPVRAACARALSRMSVQGGWFSPGTAEWLWDLPAALWQGAGSCRTETGRGGGAGRAVLAGPAGACC